MFVRMAVAVTLLSSASLAVLISTLPAPPDPKIKKFESAYQLVFTPGVQEVRIERTDGRGIVARGYMPPKRYADPEEAGDLADDEEAASRKKILAQGK